ncbi:HD domain-containing protein [Kitasatospora sp. NA04385]|uniref:HD domain-containing protein n=1 Tax=Kitasatospora sp. NA04385 TaxID=2742135 RepID=UPI0015902199|nr:HD domain-containing protein [Kitasatospora sp. NA04385]QKW22251.1 HD domain-containing protein [Kitasatospora sp. NA04385]
MVSGPGCSPSTGLLTALLGALHGISEGRTGDLTPLTRKYVTAADPRKVVADQTATAHPAIQSLFADAIAEFEEGTTPEARCAKDADKLDCLLRAAKYRAAGIPAVQGKIDRCRAALTPPQPSGSPTPRSRSTPPAGSPRRPQVAQARAAPVGQHQTRCSSRNTGQGRLEMSGA